MPESNYAKTAQGQKKERPEEECLLAFNQRAEKEEREWSRDHV